MLIEGKCHCGNISFGLDWPGEAREIPARACGCTFCVKHGGVWTSNPQGMLTAQIRDASRVNEYRFGTRTATFHVCAECGSVPFVTSNIDAHLYAVVNVNTFENIGPSTLKRGAADFEGEDMGARLGRRARNWIPEVRISVGK